MYEYADKVLDYLNRRYIAIFSKLKQRSLAKLDEITILDQVEKAYRELLEITIPVFLQVANWAYRKRIPRGYLAEAWLIDFLNSFSPVTRYVFFREVERKKSRLFESLVASQGDIKEIDKALRYWSKMISEYAVEITDAAVIEALEDTDVDEVEWFTEEDERVCSQCGKRRGKVYPINQVPPKPHWGCRCYLLPHISE